MIRIKDWILRNPSLISGVAIAVVVFIFRKLGVGIDSTTLILIGLPLVPSLISHKFTVSKKTHREEVTKALYTEPPHATAKDDSEEI